MAEKRNLERIFVIDNEIVDSHGNKVKADPVSGLDLFFMNRTRDEPEDVIRNRAPENADCYMQSEHGFMTCVEYRGLCQDRVPNAPENSITAVQYWKKSK